VARAFLFVMDSVGIGGAPDAAAFGDAGADTVGHIAEACAAGLGDRADLRQGPLRLPVLTAMGLGQAARLATGRTPPGLEGAATGRYAAAAEVSKGKDTPSGHWEIAGLPVPFDWGYFPNTRPAFPAYLTARLIEEAGLPGILGDRHASGTEIIVELGEEHLRTGKPICYTSVDSVLQIAAHEAAFGLERLYEVCEIAHRLTAPMRIGRVIARPFLGTSAADFARTPNRRDFAIPPPGPTLCDRVTAAGGRVIAIGKLGDIFAHRGVSEVRKGPDDAALFDRALGAMRDARAGDLVFANFVEFDSLYGHRRDVPGYAAHLERFDAWLPAALTLLQDGDLMIVTADHGNDPTWTGTDHTREQVPVLIAGPEVSPGSAGRRESFADIGETVAAHLGLAPGAHGRAIPLR